MRYTRLIIGGFLFLGACGGSSPSQGTTNAGHEHGPDTTATGDKAEANANANEFQIRESTTAKSAHGVNESQIKATATLAAMKFFVVDKAKDEPIAGIVISLEGADAKKFYTGETDALGYAEVLVPVGQSYDLAYLSLGRKDITAKVKVEDEAYQNIKLTLRYKPRAVEKVAVATPAGSEPEQAAAEDARPAFRLDGVVFDSASSVIQPESFDRLDSVVEYMTYKPNSRIEISGHTDNVGAAKKNKALSQSRAQACKDYLTEKGIDSSRIEAVGYGDEKPVARNDSDTGRQENRRIEVREL